VRCMLSNSGLPRASAPWRKGRPKRFWRIRGLHSIALARCTLCCRPDDGYSFSRIRTRAHRGWLRVSFPPACFVREQLGSRVDKACSSVDGGSRVVRRDRVDRQTDAIVGDRFEFVALGEKGEEFSLDTRFSPR
jgi:hypothetical protein